LVHIGAPDPVSSASAREEESAFVEERHGGDWTSFGSPSEGAREELGEMPDADKPPSLSPTAVGLAVLFLGSLYLFVQMDDGFFSLGAGVLSLLVALTGAITFGLSGLWAASMGCRSLARSRFSRAALYLCVGVAVVIVVRQHGRALDDFRRQLAPGTSVPEAIRRLDALYTLHPNRWRYISGSGISQELALADDRRIGTSDAHFTWWRGTPRTPAELTATAEALSKTRQVWFTFRGEVGFLHFFVTLDERGLIESVSESTGHQD
jgi:hypothetical protein